MLRLTVFFFYTFALTLTLPVLLPQLHLIYFAPFLVASFYRSSKINALWLAVLCGTIIDLLSAHTTLGFYALAYTLTVLIFYSQQRNYFEDRLSTLPIMTFLFAVTTTVIQATLLFVFDNGITFTWEWITNDLLLNPLYDALYALLAFTLPTRIFLRPQNRPSNMLNLKRRI